VKVRTYVNRKQQSVKFEIGDFECEGGADDVEMVGDALLRAVKLARGIEPTENELDRISHKDALASALQSVADAAAHLTEFSTWYESSDNAIVILGRLQDLQTALDAARALGWQTTDERLDAEAMFYGKGTGL